MHSQLELYESHSLMYINAKCKQLHNVKLPMQHVNAAKEIRM